MFMGALTLGSVDLETRTRSPGGFDRGLGLAELVVHQSGEKGGKSIRRA